MIVFGGPPVLGPVLGTGTGPGTASQSSPRVLGPVLGLVLGWRRPRPLSGLVQAGPRIEPAGIGSHLKPLQKPGATSNSSRHLFPPVSLFVSGPDRVMRCLNPAPLHHQLGLAVLLACGEPSQNVAYMPGLGHVADIVRVWGWAWLQRLHHQDFLRKSLSTHEALFLRRYRRGISEAHFCACWRQCWVLALQKL